MLLVKLWGWTGPDMGMEMCAALLLLGARLGGRWGAQPTAGPGPRRSHAAPETTRWLPAGAAHAGRKSVGATWAAGNAHPSQHGALQGVAEEPPLTGHRVRCSQ